MFEENVTIFEANKTLQEEDDPLSNIFIVVPACFFGFFVSLVAAVGNCAVIFACLWDMRLKSQLSTLLIVNLAFADLMTILLTTLPSTISVALGGWPFGHILCVAQCQFYHTSLLASMLSLAFISIERGIAILKPLHYHQYVNANRMYLCMAFSWIQPIFTIAHVNYNFDVKFRRDEVLCGYNPKEFISKLYIVLPSMIFNVFIVTTVIVTSNVKIIMAATKGNKPKPSVRKVQPTDANSKQKSNKENQDSDNANIKIVISILLIVIVYVLCILPYVSIKIFPAFFPSLFFPAEFRLFAVLFQFLSSAINPFIYGILRKDFQEAFKKMFNAVKRALFFQ